jgi:hypothetical protein
MKVSLRILLALLSAFAILFAAAAFRAGAQNPPANPRVTWDDPYTVEYYYKVKWGYADEFIRLFRKNHLPVLLEDQRGGRILQISAVRPKFHATEDGRWDYRVTIVYKNVNASHDWPGDEQALLKKMFPDQETFKREEQRRFEILLAHWDLPIVPIKLE